eukprot:scaffold15549_cov25-Phaeocystis_antarctica.AAC.1
MYPSRLYHAGNTVLRTWDWGLGLVRIRTGARAGAEADGVGGRRQADGSRLCPVAHLPQLLVR